MAFPWHERHEEVTAKSHLTILGAGSVGEGLSLFDPVAGLNEGLLVVAGPLVGALEFTQQEGVALAVVAKCGDEVCTHGFDDTRAAGDHYVAGVVGGAQFHTGADEGRFVAQQRHSLALHVRTHEGTVGVVVLQERNHGGSYRHHLARGHIHVVHFACGDDLDVPAFHADLDGVLNEAAFRVHLRVGLGHDVPVFLISGEVVDNVGGLPIFDATVRRLDETERVNACVGRERADQTNVRTLRRLNRAHAAVVRGVDVTNIQAGAFTRQTARSEGGQTALVRQARQGVVLVHELRQLRRSEELADRCRHGAHVDQRGRRDGFRVLRGHALTHDTLHARQADANLVLDQLADGAEASVTEVVDIVSGDHQLGAVGRFHRPLTGVQTHQVLNGGQDVFFGQRVLARGGAAAQTELAVHLVATNLRQVIPLRVEEAVVQQSLSGIARG